MSDTLRTKALAAASSAPLRRRLVPAPALKDGGEPRFTAVWTCGLVGKLNEHACAWLVEEGLVAQSAYDEHTFELTEKGSARLARERAAERAWLA